MIMRALTISQPWAELIASGTKYVENRSYRVSYRGTLAIHAGKGNQFLSAKQIEAQGYVTGAVVAIAELVAVINLNDALNCDHDLPIEDTRFTIGDIVGHQYTEGPELWILDNVRRIEPIAVPGKQGIWMWSVDQSSIKYLEASHD